jgi:ATP-dependent helicase HrpB
VPVLPALPVDELLPEIQALLRARRAVVITAAPGAGKTTRVAPALVTDGPVLLLQPRRIAARSIARRIATERGWTAGEEVGWHVRFDPHFSARTRLLVATEGILATRAQADPLLSDFSTVVIDEFHERSLHADLALALARQAWIARDDLRLVVMSATLDVDPVSRYLANCPVVRVPGRLHPVEVRYSGATLPDAVDEAIGATSGSILCFLPGAPEIRRATPEVSALCAGRGIPLLPLHGSLTADEQDLAIRDTGERTIILATNIAETSLTVPRVTAVVDSGLHKVLRFDAARGLDRLETERIPRSSADQRAGRAGRTAPGVVWRLWDPRDRLRPHGDPEIARADLCGAVLDVLGWGGDPRTFEWFEPPREDRLEAALSLLERLDALAHRRLTDLGRQLHRLPLHPRLGRILLADHGSRLAARACALLSERTYLPPRAMNTACDLLPALDAWNDVPLSMQRAAREIEQLASRLLPADGSNGRTPTGETGLRKALFAGYPDRLARRREAHSPRLLLTSGHGAVLARESGVREAEYLVAIDVQGGEAEALVRLASAVDREWFDATAISTMHHLDPSSGKVRALRQSKYGEIVLDEDPVPPAPDRAASLLVEAFLAAPRKPEDEQWLRRLRFAGLEVDVAACARAVALRYRSVAEFSVADVLPRDVVSWLERLAPSRLSVPSGRTVALEYCDDGRVQAAVKLQEVFGLAESPRLGPQREPVVFVLLSPSGRPVQTTRDLRSFWNEGYAEVRKELRGRYPRHPWPEDPWTAKPTARTTTRSGGA